MYADADLVVVDKPPGLVVHPGAGNEHGTLVQGLLARYPELADVGDPAPPGDRPPPRQGHLRADGGGPQPRRVRGAGAAAGGPSGGAALPHSGLGRARRPERARRRAHRPLGPGADPHGRHRAGTRGPHPLRGAGGLPRPRRRGAARVPAGDRPHPPDPRPPRRHRPPGGGRRPLRRARPALPVPRMFLHAAHLAFEHPCRPGERLSFDAPLPADLRAVLDGLGG